MALDNVELVVWNRFVITPVPSEATAPMIAKAISAASRPYSMAVAPDSSAIRRRPILVVAFMPRLRAGHRSR